MYKQSLYMVSGIR